MAACAPPRTPLAPLPQPSSAPPPQTDAASPLAKLNETLAERAARTTLNGDSSDYRIGPGDLIQITLFNVPSGEEGVTPRTQEEHVNQEGVIALPLLGDIPAGGLTVAALEQELRKRYDKYLYDPQVGVSIKEYRSQEISVIGAVAKPGVFPLSKPETLIDLLAMAGGVQIGSAGSQVHVYRQGAEGRQTYVVDLYALTNDPESVNMSVQAGDIINVPKAGMFFVDGAVSRPGSYALDRPYTLTQALASAGGVDEELAKLSEITIVRNLGHEPAETLLVNLDEIVAGRGSDPQIEADDVIVVPISGPKYFVKRFVGTLFNGLSLSSFMYR